MAYTDAWKTVRFRFFISEGHLELATLAHNSWP